MSQRFVGTVAINRDVFTPEYSAQVIQHLAEVGISCVILEDSIATRTGVDVLIVRGWSAAHHNANSPGNASRIACIDASTPESELDLLLREADDFVTQPVNLHDLRMRVL